MKKVGIITAKGGSGKSTLARHLAVAADQADFSTVILDTDPQGTLRDWGEARNKEPHVITEYGTNPDRIEQAFKRIEAAGADLLIVDTQGHSSPIPTNVAKLCDLVLVPMRPTPDDFRAIKGTVSMLQDRRVPHFVVLSQCPTNTPRPKAEAYSLLKKASIPAWMGAIHMKGIIPSSGISGETVMELEGLTDAEAKSADEFRSLFTWMRRELDMKALNPAIA
ncbi:ParA family protein [Methylobacterium nigriterrae]|uniref:ParA family protein n=1 Tax=Methylobacterium nigriterrae TaxID=3127512 RepID=UPI003013BCA2